MRKNKQRLSSYLSLLVMILSFIGVQCVEEAYALTSKDKTVDYVLIGASVGNSWKFNELPERMEGIDKKLEFISVFDTFDKSPALDEILKMEAKPKSIIIKECSVYFPGDSKKYKSLIKQWVNELEQQNIEPVLATTIPSGRPDTLMYKFKGFIKKILGKKDKLKEIENYNNWLREFANDNGYRLLDLEEVLRISESDRSLNPKYDRGDYTHLNSKAYEILDQYFKDFVK